MPQSIRRSAYGVTIARASSLVSLARWTGFADRIIDVNSEGSARRLRLVFRTARGLYLIQNITGAKPTLCPSICRQFVVALLAIALLLWSTSARAENRSCEGPASCCPATIAEDLPERVEVTVGIVLLGMYNVNEKAGTWDADFYLHEAWRPTPGFTPQTEVVNEAVRQSGQFDVSPLWPT